MNLRISTALTLSVMTLSLNAQERQMTLDEMFSLAEASNPTLVVAKSAAIEAERSLSSAKTAKTPDIEFNLSLSLLGNAWVADRDFSNGMNAEMPHFGNMFSLAVTQVLYAGGAIKNSITMAELARDVANLSVDAQRQAVRAIVAGYYLDLCQLRNRAVVIEKNIDQTRKLVEDIEANFQAGTVLRSDVTRYELQLQSLLLSQTKTRAALTITNRNLTEALGLPAETRIAPDTALIVISGVAEPEEHWLAMADECQSVAIARKRSEMTSMQTEISRAPLRPSVALRIEDKLEGPITYEVPTLDKNVNYYYAGVMVSYNIGALYKQKRIVAQSREAERTAEAELAETVSNCRTRTHAAYVSLHESIENRETHVKSVQLAHENYDVVHYRYLNGMALITDMLDASNQQLSAELALADADILIAYNRLLLLASVGQL